MMTVRVLLHLTTHNGKHTHTLGRTPLDECSAPRRPPPDNSQHSQQTDIHASGGISKPQSEQASVVADPRL